METRWLGKLFLCGMITGVQSSLPSCKQTATPWMSSRMDPNPKIALYIAEKREPLVGIPTSGSSLQK
jgi:hypothetical protein